MNEIAIKLIDFSSNSMTTKNIMIPDLNINSAKSVSYVVKWQLARKRSGSASTKLMSQISGTTAKPWKQKGTGRARQGSRRSVQFVGGRACHGPRPRSYDFKMPKQIINSALSDVISNKIIENKLVLYNKFPDKINTNQIYKTLENNNIKKALFISSNDNVNISKSIKNIKNTKVISSSAINVYDIIKYDYVIVEDNLVDSKIIKMIK